MILLVVLFVTIIFLWIENRNVLKEMREVATDTSLDEKTNNLPPNEEICKEIQQMIGSNCDITLDEEAKSSAYIFFQNKIILSNIQSSKKNYTRILFIAHECIHSIQEKKTHLINFVLANIRNLYDVVLLILLFLGKGNMELITLSFFISFLSFYYRMILETDAVYRSVMLSRKYLEKKNLGFIADRYEEIVPKTIKGMYFSYMIPIIIKIALYTMINCIINFI